jgi:hypothetical protein
MKNKVLILGAAILLASGIAFGYAHYSGGQCCGMKVEKCENASCPACPDQACCKAKYARADEN